MIERVGDLVVADGTPLDSRSCAVVISHDCDLLSDSLVKEPYFEIVDAVPIEGSAHGHILHGKNPREIALNMMGGMHHLSIHARSRVDRSALGSLNPAGHLDEPEIRLLRRWIAQRYQRAAFPDAFNERIASATSKVVDKLKKSGDAITGVYFLVADDELDINTTYDLAIYVSMLSEDYSDPVKRDAAAALLGSIEAHLDKCSGISVIEGDVKPESDISLDDMRSLRRWDAESVSFRKSPLGEMAPD